MRNRQDLQLIHCLHLPNVRHFRMFNVFKYSQVSINVTPNDIISYMLRKFYSPTKHNGKTSECYVLSVIACSTPFFVNCTSISVNFEKIKVTIHESIHFQHVFTFIPYSL